MGGRAARAENGVLTRWLGRAVIGASALVLGSWLVVALAHVDDTYNVDHVTGAWFALAKYVNEGVLYPPLFNGDVFGGTRYMPLQFVIHAGLAKVTGEYLISGKLLAYAGAAALGTAMFLVCRAVSGSKVLAAGLVAVFVTTPAAFNDTTTVRGDTLPAALQLIAVTLVARESRVATTSAGVLCALAFLGKLSALWGPIAISIWFAFRDRRRLWVFLAVFAGCSLMLLLLFELASGGRMSDNIFQLATGNGDLSVSGTLHKIVNQGQAFANGTWILFPFALVALGAAMVKGRLSIYHVSFMVAVPILIVVMRDIGADFNHFIDVEVLVGVLLADLWRMATTREAGGLVLPLVLAAVLWGTLVSYQTSPSSLPAYRENAWTQTKTAVRALLGQDVGYHADPLLGVLKRGDRILSDDPYLAVARSQDPVVLDAFMLVKIAREHPAWQAELVRQITAHRFTKVLLFVQLSDPSASWWRAYDLGTPIATAIARNYRIVDVIPSYQSALGFFIYAPRSIQRGRRS